jgi:hypothetical protein
MRAQGLCKKVGDDLCASGASAVNSALQSSMTIHEITEAIIGAANEVHRALGLDCWNRLIGSALCHELHFEDCLSSVSGPCW